MQFGLKVTKLRSLKTCGGHASANVWDQTEHDVPTVLFYTNRALGCAPLMSLDLNHVSSYVAVISGFMTNSYF